MSDDQKQGTEAKIPEGMRKCKICNEIKNLNNGDFYRYAIGKNGKLLYYSFCKDCKRKKQNAKYERKTESFKLIYLTFCDLILNDYINRLKISDMTRKYNLTPHFVRKIINRLNADGKINKAIDDSQKAEEAKQT